MASKGSRSSAARASRQRRTTFGSESARLLNHVADRRAATSSCGTPMASTRCRARSSSVPPARGLALQGPRRKGKVEVHVCRSPTQQLASSTRRSCARGCVRSIRVALPRQPGLSSGSSVHDPAFLQAPRSPRDVGQRSHRPPPGPRASRFDRPDALRHPELGAAEICGAAPVAASSHGAPSRRSPCVPLLQPDDPIPRDPHPGRDGLRNPSFLARAYISARSASKATAAFRPHVVARACRHHPRAALQQRRTPSSSGRSSRWNHSRAQRLLDAVRAMRVGGDFLPPVGLVDDGLHLVERDSVSLARSLLLHRLVYMILRRPAVLQP